jgi:ankyrin repeat protein
MKIRQRNGMSAQDFFAAVEKGDVQSVERLLAADESLVSARNNEGLSPIAISAYWSRSEVLDALLATAPTLDLWDASITGNIGRIEELVKSEPDLVRERSPDGFTALHLAAFFGHPRAVQVLIDHGSDVLSRTTNALNNQPLHAAVAGRDVEGRLACARTLLAHGALVNKQQSGGFTPLMSAAQSGDQTLVILLLDHGADPSIRDDEGRSATDHARSAGHEEIAELLGRDLGISSPPQSD